MAGYLPLIKKQKSVYLQSFADDLRARRDRDYFVPSGTQVYCGVQGSGKTISAVKHVRDLKRRWPKAIIVSNLQLTEFEPITFSHDSELRLKLRRIEQNQYVFFESMQQLEIALVNVNNGFHGVIYLIDEIHTYFNALDSKNIPMYVFTEISQQRKQRKVIIGTSQLFLRMAKPFREQCDNLIVCNTLFGVLTIQRAFDGMSISQDYEGKLMGKMRKLGWFWHDRKLRSCFDTYQKVVSGAEQYEQIQRMQFTGKKGKSIEIS